MGGIGALGHTFHGAVVILKILDLNGKALLIQLITLPDRAIHCDRKRVYRTPRTRIGESHARTGENGA